MENLSADDTMVCLFGIFKFDLPLICDKSVLGQQFIVSVGGVSGKLELPSSPEQLENLSDPLSEPLVPPLAAKTWGSGNKPISWGLRFAYTYPKGNPQIHRALFSFYIPARDAEIEAARVHKDIGRWKKLFFDALDLRSKRCLEGPSATVIDTTNSDFYLFSWTQEGKQWRPFTPDNDGIVIVNSGWTAIIPTHQHLYEVCRLASTIDFAIPTQHRFQLDAHRAFQQGDYRKSIAETGVATEIAITQLIENKFSVDRIDYADAIRKKFKMLGGRIALARAMNFWLPKNIEERLLEPRNCVAHQDHTPSISEARDAIETTDEILERYFPLLPPTNSSCAP